MFELRCINDNRHRQIIVYVNFIWKFITLMKFSWMFYKGLKGFMLFATDSTGIYILK